MNIALDQVMENVGFIALGGIMGAYFVPLLVPILLRRVHLRAGGSAQTPCSAFAVSRLQWVGCALAGLILGGLVALAHVSGAVLMAVMGCGFIMLLGVVCDLHSRVLPYECCVALAFLGGVTQLLIGGWEGVCTGAFYGLVVGVVCVGVNYKASFQGKTPLGWGDVRCMVALSLTTGMAAPIGMAACFVSAAGISALRILRGKLSLRDGIPFAPFLSVWLVVGLAVGI